MGGCIGIYVVTINNIKKVTMNKKNKIKERYVGGFGKRNKKGEMTNFCFIMPNTKEKKNQLLIFCLVE